VVGGSGLVFFVAGLLLLEVIPRRHFSPLLHAAWIALPQSATSRAMVRRVAELPPRRRVVVESSTRDRMDLEMAANELGISDAEAAVRLARSMMQLSGAGTPSDRDEEIGRWLASSVSVAERDRAANRLVASGVDPLVMHDLEDAYRRLQALPRRAWTSDRRHSRLAGRVRLRGAA
jgi:hypothetical protein